MMPLYFPKYNTCLHHSGIKKNENPKTNRFITVNAKRSGRRMDQEIEKGEII